MDKKQIAKTLVEMAVLMEIRGDNPFKIRAHQNAARILDGLSENINDLVESGEITNIKGIGKGMAEKIATLLNDQILVEYRELKAAIPESLLEIAKISGMGPKKVKSVWKEFDITTIEQLEEACQKNQLAGMKGFGAKTQAKILDNIALLKTFSGRYLISEAREMAVTLLNSLQDFPGVIRCEIAGSLRRRKEIVRDIDLVISAQDEDRLPIMDHFTTLPGVETISEKGDTKSRIILKTGIGADLRIVTDHQFPYILHHGTGSKEHNVAMRRLAKTLGMKLSEYGLFQGDALIPCRDEAAIYRHLGMEYIPPELRENYGEMEAAAADQLPEPLEMKDLRGVIHTHSTWSDGHNSIQEMADACQALGYQYLVVSDHSKAAAYANGLNEERVKRQQAEIDEINGGMDNFRILKSIECDILADGRLDYSDDVLASFDLVIASVHSKFGMTEAEATERIIRAMENPYVTILGHLTGRLLLQRKGYPLNQPAVIDAAADLGVAIEINANPRRLDLDWRFGKYAKEKGVKISINPDAHKVAGLADVEHGLAIARKGWQTKEDILNCNSAEEALAFARKRRF